MKMTWQQRIGFDIHTSYPNTTYTDLGKVTAALAAMNCTLVRNNDPGGAAKLPGIRTITVLDTLDVPTAQARVETAIDGGTWMIECVNEPKSANAAQAKLTNQAIIDKVAGRVPVLCSALALPDTTKAATIGPNDGYDYGSIHPYRADLTDTQWAGRIAGMLADAQTMAPFRPVWVTETGFWVADSNPNNYSHHPTTLANATGQLVGNLTQMLAASAPSNPSRVEGVIYYELFDTATAAEPTNHFGWINDDVTLRPWAVVLNDFMAKVGSIDPSFPVEPASGSGDDPAAAVHQQILDALTALQSGVNANGLALTTVDGHVTQASTLQAKIDAATAALGA